MLSSDELHKLADDISKSLEGEDKPLQRLSAQLARLISHLESDQRVYIALERDMNTKFDKVWNRLNEHDDALYGNKSDSEKQPGLVNEWRTFKAYLETSRKIHWMVVSGVAALLMKSLYEIITAHKIP